MLNGSYPKFFSTTENLKRLFCANLLYSSITIASFEGDPVFSTLTCNPSKSFSAFDVGLIFIIGCCFVVFPRVMPSEQKFNFTEKLKKPLSNMVPVLISIIFLLLL